MNLDWYKSIDSNDSNGLKIQTDIRYPLAKSITSGLTVLNSIPNTDSISSSLIDYEVLNGIREVPMSDFNISGKSYSVTENDKIKNLANSINNSKQIAPLIVVVEKDGPYILEGSHRIDALYQLGIKTFPALIVINLEN